MTKIIDEMFTILIERGVYRRKTKYWFSRYGMNSYLPFHTRHYLSFIVGAARFACQTSALMLSANRKEYLLLCISVLIQDHLRSKVMPIYSVSN